MKIYGNIEIIGQNSNPRDVISNGIMLTKSINIKTSSDDSILSQLINTNCNHIPGGGDVGLFAGGYSTGYGRIDNVGYYTQLVDCISISYVQNASEFGNLFSQIGQPASFSNGENDRSIFGGGYFQNNIQIRDIEFCTTSSKGNTSLFGEITNGKTIGCVGLSNGIGNIGLFSNYTTLSQINMVSLGNAEFTGSGNSKKQFGATSNGVLGRGVLAGGNWSSIYSNLISYLQITTSIRCYDFGELLTRNHSKYQALSNATLDRAVFPYNYTGNTNTIEYITISNLSNAIDFGDLLYYSGEFPGATSNGSNNNGVVTNGGGISNSIQLLNISTPGNCTDFGDLTLRRQSVSGTSNGPTAQQPSLGYSIVKNCGEFNNYHSGDRGLFVGGYNVNPINMISISTTGNSDLFGTFWYPGVLTDIQECSGSSNHIGDKATFSANSYVNNSIVILSISNGSTTSAFSSLSTIRSYSAQTSNGINNRGITAGGCSTAGVTYYNIIDYHSFITPAVAVDFGDLSKPIQLCKSTSNAINNRAVIVGGYDKTNSSNVIEYITISTLSNSFDFGDLTPVVPTRFSISATSNGVCNRGVFFGGGGNGTYDHVNNIDYISISNISNAVDFGDLTSGRKHTSALSNGVFNRGVVGGGYAGGSVNIIEYVTITTISNSVDFGDLNTNRYYMGAVSNADGGTINTISTSLLNGTGNETYNTIHSGDRGVFNSGRNTSGFGLDILDSITITTTGNATSFGSISFPGDITDIKDGNGASNHIGNTAVFAANRNTYSNISSINIISTNSNSNFSELSIIRTNSGQTSNGIYNRGIIVGGWLWNSASYYNVIDYYSFINPTSTVSDFGDLSRQLGYISATSNSVNNRAVIMGGCTFINNLADCKNTIDYITISTLGNSLDFGDLMIPKFAVSSTSNGIYDRAIVSGGSVFANFNIIDYISISTISNSVKFGDLTISRKHSAALSNGVFNRGVIAGGYSSFTVNVMDYIAISIPGNSLDFGDLSIDRYSLGAVSNADGGSVASLSISENDTITRKYKPNYCDCHSGNRGIFSAGTNSSNVGINPIDVISISTPGDSTLFSTFSYPGNTSDISDGGGCSNHSGDRAMFAANGYGYNTISLMNISTVTSNIDFSALSVKRSHCGQTSNGINNRGIVAGGIFINTNTNYNIIDYYSFTGSSSQATDFGDLSQLSAYCKSTSNAINNRGIIVGMRDTNTNPDYVNTIDLITISTPSNSTDFGDLTIPRYSITTTSNGVYNRGITVGGFGSVSAVRLNTIDYITISYRNNAIDFGDLSTVRTSLASLSNGIFNKAIIAGGYISSTELVTNIIESISISTPNNSTDFGDLSIPRTYAGGVSNSDGGTSITIPLENTFGESASTSNFTPLNETIYSAYDGLGGINGHINYNGLINTPCVNDCELYITLSDHLLNMFQTNKGNQNSKGGKFIKYSDDYGIRGVFGGGVSNSVELSETEYILISHESNANIFTSLFNSRSQLTATSNGFSSRGLFIGGSSPSYPYSIDHIDIINIAFIGDIQQNGNLANRLNYLTSTSNNSLNRCVVAGGMYTPELCTTRIDYINILTVDDSIKFGDLTVARYELSSGSNGRNNRAVFSGGQSTSDFLTFINVIDYVTISTPSNAVTFGRLGSKVASHATISSGISGKITFSYGKSIDVNSQVNIELLSQINITSLGNASNFGNLMIARSGHDGTSNGIGMKGIVGGGISGINNPITLSNLETFSISSPHASQSCSFGELLKTKTQLAATSNA